ncbi:MAG: DnaJ domain-containing protein [Proteobacteria bacterium]|nr:DnaJ domain-containing protein [Pseudomonadota bacterium]
MAGREAAKDLYRLVGVAPDASATEIKKAYRRKAREMHPDLDPANPWAEDEFKKLSAAYGILSDPVRRGQYDRGELDADGRKKKARPASQKSRPKRGFEGFFRDRDRDEIKIDGVDVSHVLTIEFLEAARGTKKQMKTAHGVDLNVTVPPGTLDGQVLRLKGQGMRGFNDGRDGDALIEVKVEPHPIFKSEGRDIHTNVPVGLDAAILGGKIQIETIDGLLNVTVPSNSNTGTKLRLKGRGLAEGGRKDATRGDHYISLIVTLPDEADPELAEFIRARSERAEE